jgi:hypothetical protein
MRVRLLYIVGALVTTALIFLGALLPTLFSIFALLAIPAPGIFVIAAIKPEVLAELRMVRVYLWICVALSIGSWVAQISWMVSK